MIQGSSKYVWFLDLDIASLLLGLWLLMVVKLILLGLISNTWIKTSALVIYTLTESHHTAKTKVIACLTILSVCIGLGKKLSKFFMQCLIVQKLKTIINYSFSRVFYQVLHWGRSSWSSNSSPFWERMWWWHKNVHKDLYRR